MRAHEEERRSGETRLSIIKNSKTCNEHLDFSVLYYLEGKHKVINVKYMTKKKESI